MSKEAMKLVAKDRGVSKRDMPIIKRHTTTILLKKSMNAVLYCTARR